MRLPIGKLTETLFKRHLHCDAKLFVNKVTHESSFRRTPIEHYLPLQIFLAACRMKPVTDAETNIASEDKVRKSLHELQPSATDKETLVGADRADRMIKSTQQAKEAKSKKNVPTKTKKDVSKKQKKVTTNDKAVQTVSEEKIHKIEIEAEDLTCTDLAGPSENYWQVQAERRRIALKNTLEENEQLVKRIEKLEEEKRIYKEMLNETRALVEVLQDMIGDDRNDINNSLEDSVL